MGHAEPQMATKAETRADSHTDMQAHWMPFSPNKEFKSEPKMVTRAKGMYFYTPDGCLVFFYSKAHTKSKRFLTLNTRHCGFM